MAVSIPANVKKLEWIKILANFVCLVGEGKRFWSGANLPKKQGLCSGLNRWKPSCVSAFVFECSRGDSPTKGRENIRSKKNGINRFLPFKMSRRDFIVDKPSIETLHATRL